MTLADLLTVLKSGHWLPIIALLTLYARKLASPSSGFPLEIPQRWLGTVTAAGGLVYGFVSQLSVPGTYVGDALVPALVAAGSGGFLDGLLTAIFAHEAAPAWGRALVFVFDDVTTGGVPPTTPTATAPTTSAVPTATTTTPPTPPIASPRLMWGGCFAAFVVVAAFAFSQMGCGSLPTVVAPPNTPTDITNAVACVVADLSAQQPLTNCITQYGADLIADALMTALDSKELAAKDPKAIEFGQKLAAQLASGHLPAPDAGQ